jgi:ATP-binding cassette subfamily F protein 3
MPAVTLSEVSLSFGGRALLDGVTFTLARGAKIALYGANGSGKTTLMRVIVGEIRPDSGGVHLERDTRLAYLPQSGLRSESGLDPRSGAYQEVEKAFAPGLRLAQELERVEAELAGSSEESPAARRLLERHQEIAERLEAGFYYRRRERIERVLTGLGFRREEFGKEVGTFSQGWQMRIGLARVLCEEADLLLLDEPTNYLDLEARTWMEQFLRDTPAGVLIVSHDRYFLDTTVDSVAELYQGELMLYPGSFSRYERRREQELVQIAEAYERQQEEIARMEVFIRRFRYKASKARQVQSRIGQLARLERIEMPPVQKGLRFSFPDPPHAGRRALKLEGLGKAYESKVLFRGLDLELSNGEKLVLVGPNGAGKSTLMRILARLEQASEGSLTYGSGLSAGYYSPDQPEELAGAESVIERVEAWAPTALIPSLRSLLGAFLFRGDDIFKPVRVLSGGEQSRLALLRLLLHPANCLLLDEPTNHLDLVSKDVLLDALARYPGTLVFVSHDRYFIEKLATRVLELDDGRARIFPGDYAYYLWRKEREAAGEAQDPSGAPDTGRGGRAGADGGVPSPWAVKAYGSAAAGGTSAGEEREPSRGESQQARLQAKRLQSDLRRLFREEQEILAELERLARERGELEHSLASEQVYRDGSRVKLVKEQLEANGRRQEELTRRWEEVERERRARG